MKPPRQRTEVDLAHAEALLADGRHAEAATAARALVAAQPRLAGARRALARALYHAGDALGALREARIAVELAPDDADSRARLGAILLALGRVRDARGELEQAVALDPDGVFGRYNLGHAFMLEGRTHEAVECLAALVERAPTLERETLHGATELLARIDALDPQPRVQTLLASLRAVHTRPARRERRASVASSDPGSLLERGGRDLVKLAREGALEAVWGRDAEIDRVIDVLLRQRKSNPVLVGPAGVGKTAIVEGLCHRIAAGRVPRALRDARIVELPIARLVAGSAYRGELEQKLLALLDELRRDPQAILFLDEVHTLATAGGESGGVADVLKPALARGEIAVIGATTDDGFDRVLSRDPALARRFARVEVREPTLEQAAPMLRAAADELARFHGVRYEPAALDDALVLSSRVLAERRLPDKAIDVIDQAAVRATRDARTEVTVGDVRAVLADLARVPVERLGAPRLASLAATLRQHVRGQDAACERIAEVLLVRSLGLDDGADRPRGVFLFVGPPGVGKSTLARALADALDGGAERLVRIDMSEFADRHEVARLLGAPAGYVGHEHGGLLARALRERPSAVVLLDEVDRAHPDVLDAFLPLFDAGRTTDGRGETVDARAATFVMTASAPPPRAIAGFAPSAEAQRAAPRERDVHASLRESLRPELLARVDATLVFAPLEVAALADLARAALATAVAQLARQGIALRADDDVCEALAREAERDGRAGRSIARVIERAVLLPAARKAIASGRAAGYRLRVREGSVSVEDDDGATPA